MHKIEHDDFFFCDQEFPAQRDVEAHMTETTMTTTAPLPTFAMHVPDSAPVQPSPYDGDEGYGPIFTIDELQRMAILQEEAHCLAAGGSGRRPFESFLPPTVRADEV